MASRQRQTSLYPSVSAIEAVERRRTIRSERLAYPRQTECYNGKYLYKSRSTRSFRSNCILPDSLSSVSECDESRRVDELSVNDDVQSFHQEKEKSEMPPSRRNLYPDIADHDAHRFVDFLMDNVVNSTEAIPHTLEFVNSGYGGESNRDGMPYMVDSEGSSSNHSNYSTSFEEDSFRSGLTRSIGGDSFYRGLCCNKPSTPESTTIQEYSREQRPAAAPYREYSEPPETPSNKCIEIAPGHHVAVRGADETWRAIVDDFYTPCDCVCCSTTIFCIQDAKYVLCPDCRVVSPLDGTEDQQGSSSTRRSRRRRRFGVGLGFKMEDLVKWQN